MTQWGLDTLFNPAKRHMDEEKRRLQSTREQIGDNSGGRRIDLESGKVVIRPSEEQDEQPETEQTTSRRRRGAKKDPPATKDAATKTAGTREPSAAQVRAAERRKRRPS